MRFSPREWVLISAIFVLAAGWGVDRRSMGARLDRQEKQISSLQKEFALYEELSKRMRDDSSFESLREYLKMTYPNVLNVEPEDLKTP